jgi:primosomal protein N' (replication factor Y)
MSRLLRPFAEVILPLRVDKTYTYRIPAGLQGQVAPGCRVLVPLGRRTVSGVVVELSADSPVVGIKEIVDLLDPRPVFDESILQLTRWMADYYLCSWQEALRVALPAEIRQKRKRSISLKEPADGGLARKLRKLSDRQRAILEVLTSAGRMSDLSLLRQVGREGLYADLHRLQAHGFIEIREELSGPRVGVRKVRVARLRLAAEAARHRAEHLCLRAPRQAAALRFLAAESGDVDLTELRRKAAISADVIRRLAEKGWLEIFGRERYRESYAELPEETVREHTLTTAQQKAVDKISGAVEGQRFGVFLLHGITGSGKTEVYLRAIEKTLAAGRQAIVLVPEISLTPQMVSRFRARFRSQVAVFHSGLSAGERYDAWRRLREGLCRIAIGARSAVFAPLEQVGLIVVDEEHVDSYKQTEMPPRYHARDVAIMRGQRAGAVVLLGSATPSLETFQNVRRGKYMYCSLPERVDEQALPRVEIVDMCREKREDNWSILSRALKEKIARCLHRQEQIILFLNRRGFSTCIRCQECGFMMSCPHCDVTLTYHSQDLMVKCHYCGYRQKAPDTCPSCGGQHIRFRGAGTQRVEGEIASLFPQARILRMDRDTTRRRGAHLRILERFRKGQADILLGTQMIAKGLDFPRVTLVGVLMADVGLNMPDFRSSERTFQTITQVAGRAGRSALGGEVLVQTHAPGENAIRMAQDHDYAAFASRELAERQPLGYPPFGKLQLWLLQSTDETKVELAATKAAEMLRHRVGRLHLDEVQILGPAPAPLSRIRGQHRWQLLLKSPSGAALRKTARSVMGQTSRWPPWPGVRVRIVVDPVEMM